MVVVMIDNKKNKENNKLNLNLNDTENNILNYKNKNLVKSDNIFCYGNPDDKYVVLMESLEKGQEIKDIPISSKISVALFDRQEFIKNPNVMFLDFCERAGLYDALETAYMWITK